ncbi:MAG: hypothetical protein ABL901_17255 [Hyphomicrobiaceae bacterium]
MDMSKMGAGGSGAGNGNGGANGGDDGNPFKNPEPVGAAKTVSAVLGEIVWLMSQSKLHKSFFISDLEWPVASATNFKSR